jgi:N-acetylglucosamine-6-phosphate deacetylase
MAAALAALSRALDDDPRLGRAVPGLHVEGPFISAEDGPRGAHPLEHVRDPDWDEFRAFQEAAGGRIRIVTLAPERPGALPFIERLAESGVVVALGHTAAEPETIGDAVLAGARLSTHLGNGAHAQLRRHPNYIWEQLADDRLFASVIADGHHLPPAVLKCFARVKGPERLALVSDAVSLGGLPPGRYAEGRHEVLPSGRVVVAGTPYLAGAGHLQDTCVANALRQTDLTLAQVIRCASAVPARLLGLEARKGRIQVGFDADLTLFQVPEAGPLSILATVRGGEVAYRA